MLYLYLHGFASSPLSRKAQLFLDRLAEMGIQLHRPDLAPDFERLTITSQLKVVEEVVAGKRVVLIGSSLGGYLASLYAASHPEVERLVLLAPAFDFYNLWKEELGAVKLQQWRENGSISVYHYGMGRETPLGFQLMQDAQQYARFPNFEQPCLLLHGVNDNVVPFGQSSRFAAAHPNNVELISFDSGHELTDVLNEIWKVSSHFLLSSNTETG